MSTEKACIYCGKTVNLSKSDIIPDALTNAKIYNENVCEIEHNNKFSNLFESEVIKKLSFITNHLSIKSSKSKTFSKYNSVLTINGIEYNAKNISSIPKFLKNPFLKSCDGKIILASFESHIKKNKRFKLKENIDISDELIEEKVIIDLKIFISIEIFRLVSKIAFEWYCKNNNIIGYNKNFDNIILFITKGEGKNPVELIEDINLYNFLNGSIGLGHHSLFSFKDDDNIIVIVSLFGVALYKVVIGSFDQNICINNLIFEKLLVDGSHSIICKKSISDLYKEICELNYNNYTVDFEGYKFLFCNKYYSDLLLTLCFVNFIKNSYNVVERYNDNVKDILKDNILRLLNEVFIYKKSIKRFVKDYLYDKEKIKDINPNIKDKNVILKLYVVMLVGKNNAKINNDNYFYRLVRKNIHENNELNDELVQFIKNEVTNYENINFVMRGIDIINEWD